jgi:DNA-binding MarR family transcriptional regulator
MSDQSGVPRIANLLRTPYQAVMAHITDQIRAEYPDLRQAHLIVFQVIEHPPAGSRLTDLAEQAQMTVQSMGELVDGLEARGYVERIPDQIDRRVKRIRLTERGWAAHERGGAIIDELHAAWARHLGDEKFEQLLSLLRELSASLQTGPHRG